MPLEDLDAIAIECRFASHSDGELAFDVLGMNKLPPTREIVLTGNHVLALRKAPTARAFQISLDSL